MLTVLGPLGRLTVRSHLLRRACLGAPLALHGAILDPTRTARRRPQIAERDGRALRTAFFCLALSTLRPSLIVRALQGLALSIAVAFGLAATSAPVAAQEAIPAPVLIVNMDRIFRDSATAQAVQDQVNALRDATQEDLRARQDALLAEERALVALRATLAADEFAARAERFQEQARALRRERTESGAQLQRALARANTELRGALQPILQQIMVERRAGVLIDNRNVVLSVTALDVTEDAIARLDAAALEIEVRLSEGETP